MTRENVRKLAPGWAEAPLGALGEYINGRGFKKSEWRKNGRPIVRIQDLTGSQNSPNFFDGPVEDKHVVRPGDLLISWAATLGAYIWRGPEGVLNQHIFKVQTFIDKRFHHLLVQHVLADMLQRTHGTGMVHITKGEFDRTIAPVPPLAEQARIADALDELFSDLDAGVAALDQVRAKLKLYRKSILKSAVEGTLSAEWREQHPHAEPASELLQRILAERRRRWDEHQLAKIRAKGQEPPKNWNAKYKEPAAPDTANLPQLPEGWCWASLDQLAWSASYGTSEKCRETNNGLAVLRIPNILGGRVNLVNLKYARAEYSELREDLIHVGDLLVVRTNGSRNLIGRGAVVRDDQPLPLSFASYLIRLRLIPDAVLLRWVSLAWDSLHVRQWIEARAATSAGQYNISLRVLEILAIPVPPLAEQEAIVECVENQLSVIDHIEGDLETKFTSVQALRQATLRHAFTGQLVPQDPNDEPAYELLKRIAVDREARAREASTNKRAAGKTSAPRTGRRGRPRRKKAKGS